MLINPVTAAMGAIKLFSEITSHHKKEAKTEDNALANNFNVTNMSLNELKQMSQQLMEQGKVSEQDANSFFAQITSIQQSTGISSDTKVDMIRLYEQQVDNLNSASKIKDVASFQHSLDILNGVQARFGSNIPQSV